MSGSGTPPSVLGHSDPTRTGARVQVAASVRPPQASASKTAAVFASVSVTLDDQFIVHGEDRGGGGAAIAGGPQLGERGLEAISSKSLDGVLTRTVPGASGSSRRNRPGGVLHKGRGVADLFAPPAASSGHAAANAAGFAVPQPLRRSGLACGRPRSDRSALPVERAELTVLPKARSSFVTSSGALVKMAAAVRRCRSCPAVIASSIRVSPANSAAAQSSMRARSALTRTRPGAGRMQAR